MLQNSQVVVVHTFNPSTREAETGGSLCSKPDWFTESSRAPQRNTVSKKQNTKTNKQTSCKNHGFWRLINFTLKATVKHM